MAILAGRLTVAFEKSMYEKDLGPALRKAHGNKPQYRVVEDGDRTGYQSNAGKAGKRAAKIKSWKLPPRTPEWMPLDYAIWSRIEDDALTLAGPKETKATYGKKLRKAALGLGPAYVQKVCGAMKERIQGVYAAQGHHYKKD